MKLALAGALASAVLLGFAARIDALSPACALLGLAPWMLARERAGPRAAILSAAALASGMAATCYFWLPRAIAGYTGVPLFAAWTAMLLLAPIVLEPQLVLAAAAAAFAPRFRRAVFVGAWLAAEWGAPRLLPDSPGIGLYPSRALRQLAEWGGLPLLTLLCLAVSSVRTRREAAATGALLACAFGFGALRLRAVERTLQTAPRLSVGVVQAAIGSYDKLAAERGTYEAVREILDRHFALTASLGDRLDLVVWPETVYPTTFGAPKSEDGAALDAEIAARMARTPLVFGAFEQSGAGEHNAAFVLERGHIDAYRKRALFPLTERVPAWLEPWRQPWMGHWQPGDAPKLLEVNARGAPLWLAPLICYEAIAPGGIVEGAQLIVTLSNDGWFEDGAGPRLHLVAAAFRSIETRLSQVRATNSGISALVLPSGDLVGEVPFGAAAARRYDVPRAAPFHARWRALWVGPSALAMLVALLAAGLLDSLLLASEQSAPHSPGG